MRVIHEKEGSSVLRIRLERGGASELLLDEEGLTGLEGALEEASDPAVRVLVLEGEAGSFCLGMDLGFVVGLPEEDRRRAVSRFASLLLAIRQGRWVVVALVDGAAAGGGLGLAAAADLVLATARSDFGLPELSLGLLPAIVLPLLLERMVERQVGALALLGHFDAKRAHEAGLVDVLVAGPVELGATLRGVLKQAHRLCPAAVAELKEALCSSEPLERALAHGAERTAEILADPERRAALSDFLGGQVPPWFDRYRPGSTGGGR
jgi:enoyl-CoA hydratase/carnithine racemase